METLVCVITSFMVNCFSRKCKTFYSLALLPSLLKFVLYTAPWAVLSENNLKLENGRKSYSLALLPTLWKS
jgi:hypothetical protein